MLVLCSFSQSIDGFSDKNDSTGLLELIQLYKQNPIEKIFSFSPFTQNYILALNKQIKIIEGFLNQFMSNYKGIYD